MKLLIVGSKGFIGSHAVRFFGSDAETKVYQADVMVDYNTDNYFQIDGSNADFNEIFEQEQFDCCLNCSGAASVPDSLNHTLRDFTLNTFNVAKLLEAIKKHNRDCRFLNLSSAAVYGNPTTLPITENMLLSPVSPYGNHKLMAEQIAAEYSRFSHLYTCSLRIFSAYGTGLRKQILWDICRKAAGSEEVTLFGTGNETRDFIHVDDILRAVDLVIKNGKFEAETYNVANGTETSIRNLAEMVLKALDYTGVLKFTGNERQGDPINWRADVGKIEALGYKQKVPLADGINQFVQWVKEGA